MVSIDIRVSGCLNRILLILSILGGIITLLNYFDISHDELVKPGTIIIDPEKNLSRNIVAPDEFISNYWELINAGQYESNWDKLAPNFQQDMHESQYSNYLDGWQRLHLCTVRAENIRVLEQTSEKATVAAHLVFQAGDTCQRSEQDFDFYLVINPGQTTWLISEVKVQ